MAEARSNEMEQFSLGTPALVCRWRLSAGTVLLQNRHMKALARRSVDGMPISPELVAWAKQHVEWTLAEGSSEYPDGVLMLIIDEAGAAAMTVGPYERLASRDYASLAARAREALREQDETDVAPETLFAIQGDDLLVALSPDIVPSGSASLVLQLSVTLGIPVTYMADLMEQIDAGEIEPDGVFLASDEHGLVAASDLSNALANKFEASYIRLFKAAHRNRR